MEAKLTRNIRAFKSIAATVAVLTLGAACATAQPLGDPLPSRNDGQSKKSILEFVTKTTKSGSPDFVPVSERISTFDNDGTLWAEQPMYFQLEFAFDRIKKLAPQHLEWNEKEPQIGRLDKAWDEAIAKGWLVVSMKTDWKTIFPAGTSLTLTGRMKQRSSEPR